MTKKIRWGIAATGPMARQFAQDFRHSEGGELTAVCSRTQSKADTFAKDFDMPHAFASLSEMLAANVVDLVYICSPHVAHYEQSLECLEAGHSVLCEKPMTISAEQTRDLYRVAETKQCFIMEAMWARFNPNIQAVKQLLTEGAIGTPLQLQADFGFCAQVSDDHRLLDPKLGGGALWDVGIYPIFLAHYLLGLPEQVKSSVHKNKNGIDLSEQIIFEYDGGTKQAQLSASLNRYLPNRAYIAGTEGYIEIPGLWLTSRSFEWVHFNKGQAQRQTMQQEFAGTGWHFEISHVNECLRQGLLSSPMHRPEDSIALATQMDGLFSDWR
ncbi:MAG: dehydrogenase [Alteromonadaceae bacterium]|nr:MAG: dehydrogenase [Alteromonadaceae bacterium]